MRLQLFKKTNSMNIEGSSKQTHTRTDSHTRTYMHTHEQMDVHMQAQTVHMTRTGPF